MDIGLQIKKFREQQKISQEIERMHRHIQRELDASFNEKDALLFAAGGTDRKF